MEVDGAQAHVEGPWPPLLESKGAALLAAWFGGFGVGTGFVLLSSWTDSGARGVSVALLFIGLIWLSVWFRHFGSLIGAILAAWLWQLVFNAHERPNWADILTLTLARDGVVAFGLVVPVVAHAISMLFRRRPRRLHEVRGAFALGLAAMFIFAVSAAVEARVPTTESFEITLPSGWTAYHPVAGDQDLPPAMYGADFSALLGNKAPEPDLSRPPAPMAGVTVYEATNDSTGAVYCDIWSGWSSRVYGAYHQRPVDWKPPQVAAPGADLQVSLNEVGDSFFVLEVPRSRQVGLATEHLCYLMVVSVPATATMAQSDIDAIFSSFRYR